MAKPFKPGFFSNLNGIKDNNDRPPLVGGSGGGSGTTNTFTNLGIGARVFAALVGDDVQFRTVTSNDPRIVVDEAGDNVRVGMNFNWTQGTVAPPGTVALSYRLTTNQLTGNNTSVTNRYVGAREGSGLTTELSNDTIVFGTNPTVLGTLLAPIIAPLLPPLLTFGETNTASNRGAGEGVFAAKVGVDLQFKSLVAGDNVTLESDDNTITINATGGGGGGPGGGGQVGSGGDEKAARFTNLQNQTLTSGAFTILDYDDVVTNNSPTTYTNNGAGRVTVTETGFYTLTAGLAIQASLLSAVSTTALAIFRNGQAIAAETNSQTLAVGETRIHTCATSIQLNAGDIIDARAYVLSVLGLGNILAILLPFLFGQNATQINHLSLVKQETGDSVVYDGQNLGSGTGEVFRQVTGGDTFQFRTLRAGPNVTITQDANEVTVSASGGGGSAEDTTPPLMVGAIFGTPALSTTTNATKGLFLTVTDEVTLKGAWGMVDAASSANLFQFNVSQTSGTTIGSTVTNVLGTTATVDVLDTTARAIPALFPTPIVLSPGTYLLSMTLIGGAGTAILRTFSPSVTTGAINTGCPFLRPSVGNNTVQIPSADLTAGDTIAAIGTSNGYAVFPIL